MGAADFGRWFAQLCGDALTQKGESCMYTATKFVRVDNTRIITKQTDSEFYFEFQRGVLLSLKEQGVLTETQFKCAENALSEQRRAVARTMLQQGGEPS